MSPEEHTAAIRSLQGDVADIKGILNNGLRAMVQDEPMSLATVKEDPADPRLAHRSRRQARRDP
jgi:hypothetical protein